MMRLPLTMLLLASHLLAPVSASPEAVGALELYGTFHAMGITVRVGAADDTDWSAVASVQYRIHGQGPYRPGQPLARVSNTQFTGSLFWLYPGTAYDVRVILHDPGGVLDGVRREGVASTRAEITTPAATRSYYVSPNGSGTACSQASPCSLVDGLNRAQPGEEVVLRGGVYYQGDVTLPRSGGPGAPIVIRGYPGETAILDGADPTDFGWSHEGGGVWRTTINVADTHLVAADGERLYPYGSLSDLQNLAWGLPGFYDTGTTLYVRLAGNADPNQAAMAVSRWNNGFKVMQNFVHILDLTFRHYGQGHYGRALYLRNGSDNLVQGCTFALNDRGIALKLDSHRNVFQDNEFYDTLFSWHWDAVKDAGGLETNSIEFWDPDSSGDNMIGRGNIVRRNVFHDSFDGPHVCPSEDQGQGETNETDVYENLVYRVGDDGMEADGACSNVRIWNNTFHDVMVGISMAPSYVGPVYAIRNLIYRTGAGTGMGADGATAFKFQSSKLGSGPIYLFHNTSEAGPGGRGIYIAEPLSWPRLVSRNNTWISDDAYALHYNANDPIDFDYDLLLRKTTPTGTVVRWHDARYSSLEEFRAATGQELNGLGGPPGFANPAGGDYTPASGSPLIDAGVRLWGINDSYGGDGPDIGAFETPAYGVFMNVWPPAEGVAPGGSAQYLVEVRPAGGYNSPVTLSVSGSSPDLKLALEPTTLTPPATAFLTLTDDRPGADTLPGVQHRLSISAKGKGVSTQADVTLMAGGVQIYLPMVHPTRR